MKKLCSILFLLFLLLSSLVVSCSIEFAIPQGVLSLEIDDDIAWMEGEENVPVASYRLSLRKRYGAEEVFNLKKQQSTKMTQTLEPGTYILSAYAMSSTGECLGSYFQDQLVVVEDETTNAFVHIVDPIGAGMVFLSIRADFDTTLRFAVEDPEHIGMSSWDIPLLNGGWSTSMVFGNGRHTYELLDDYGNLLKTGQFDVHRGEVTICSFVLEMVDGIQTVVEVEPQTNLNVEVGLSSNKVIYGGSVEAFASVSGASDYQGEWYLDGWYRLNETSTTLVLRDCPVGRHWLSYVAFSENDATSGIVFFTCEYPENNNYFRIDGVEIEDFKVCLANNFLFFYEPSLAIYGNSSSVDVPLTYHGEGWTVAFDLTEASSLAFPMLGYLGGTTNPSDMFVPEMSFKGVSVQYDRTSNAVSILPTGEIVFKSEDGTTKTAEVAFSGTAAGLGVVPEGYQLVECMRGAGPLGYLLYQGEECYMDNPLWANVVEDYKMYSSPTFEESSRITSTTPLKSRLNHKLYAKNPSVSVTLQLVLNESKSITLSKEECVITSCQYLMVPQGVSSSIDDLSFDNPAGPKHYVSDDQVWGLNGADPVPDTSMDDSSSLGWENLSLEALGDGANVGEVTIGTWKIYVRAFGDVYYQTQIYEEGVDFYEKDSSNGFRLIEELDATGFSEGNYYRKSTSSLPVYTAQTSVYLNKNSSLTQLNLVMPKFSDMTNSVKMYASTPKLSSSVTKVAFGYEVTRGDLVQTLSGRVDGTFDEDHRAIFPEVELSLHEGTYIFVLSLYMGEAEELSRVAGESFSRTFFGGRPVEILCDFTPAEFFSGGITIRTEG